MFQAISLWFGVGRRRLCSSRELSPRIFSLVGGGSEWFVVVRSGADTPSLYKKNSTAHRGIKKLYCQSSYKKKKLYNTSPQSGVVRAGSRVSRVARTCSLRFGVERGPLRSSRDWFGEFSASNESGSLWFASRGWLGDGSARAENCPHTSFR